MSIASRFPQRLSRQLHFPFCVKAAIKEVPVPFRFCGRNRIDCAAAHSTVCATPALLKGTKKKKRREFSDPVMSWASLGSAVGKCDAQLCFGGQSPHRTLANTCSGRALFLHPCYRDERSCLALPSRLWILHHNTVFNRTFPLGFIFWYSKCSHTHVQHDHASCHTAAAAAAAELFDTRNVCVYTSVVGDFGRSGVS